MKCYFSEKDKKDYKHRFKVYKANGIDKIELINQLKLGEKKLILDFLDPDTIKYKKRESTFFDTYKSRCMAACSNQHNYNLGIAE